MFDLRINRKALEEDLNQTIDRTKTVDEPPKASRAVLTMLRPPGYTVAYSEICEELGMTENLVVGALRTLRHAGYGLRADHKLRNVAALSAGWDRVRRDGETVSESWES
jgi:hypothetical protein